MREWKKSEWLMMCLGTLIIICFYMMAIPKIYTVWNLVDEYGYLANAAYLSGAGWEPMTNFYYGYGYSLWLIPLFWICENGIWIIRGAMMVNTLCIVLLFWVQYILMSKLYKEMNRKMLAFLSFALCFYPYLVVSNYKVVCECLLTLMIWVCGLLLYQALDTGKWYWYVLLGIATAYTYFVHTRSFVFIFMLLVVVVVMFAQKKITAKNVLLYIGVAGVFFIIGAILQNHIIDVMYTNIPGGAVTEDVGNTYTVSYIWEKVISFIKELSIVDFNSFACKVFYLFIGTAGILPLGVYVIVKNSLLAWKNEKLFEKENAILLMYAMALLAMVIALVVNPMGELEGNGHYFYARYYECLIGPVAFAGALYCMSQKLNIREMIGLVIIFMLFGWFTGNTSDYLETYELYLNTGHMPAFSYIVQYVNWFGKAVEIGTKVTVVLILLLFLMTQLKKLRWSIPVLLLVLSMVNNIWNVKFTININNQNTVEYQVAAYVRGNYGVDEVYFLNKDTNDLLAYTKIQSLMGNVKVHVVDPGDWNRIEQGVVVVTSAFNPYVEELAGTEKVWAGGSYEIYTVNE